MTMATMPRAIVTAIDLGVRFMRGFDFSVVVKFAFHFPTPTKPVLNTVNYFFENIFWRSAPA